MVYLSRKTELALGASSALAGGDATQASGTSGGQQVMRLLVDLMPS